MNIAPLLFQRLKLFCEVNKWLLVIVLGLGSFPVWGVTEQHIEVSIESSGNGHNDGYEEDGQVLLEESELVIGENIITGLRFENVSIPKNSIISDAYIVFKNYDDTVAELQVTVQGEQGNSLAFTDAIRNFSDRSKTMSVTSTLLEYSEDNSFSVSLLGTLVSEIVRKDWEKTGNMSFFLSLINGEPISIEPYESGKGAAILYIKYTLPEPKPQKYDSTPDSGTTLELINTFGTLAAFELFIRNEGDEPLTIYSADIEYSTDIEDANRKQFKITEQPEFPVTFYGSTLPTKIEIQCDPPPEGEAYDEAELVLKTNAANSPEPSYPLLCKGETPAGYASEPLPNSTIEVVKTEVGKPTVIEITVEEVGEQDLEVKFVGLKTDWENDFQIIVSPPFTIKNDQKITRDIRIKCKPSTPGLRTATLELETNDPSNQFPTYELQCEGIEPSASYHVSLAPEDIPDLSTTIGDSTGFDIKITETGNAALTIDAQLNGEHANNFNVTPKSLKIKDGDADAAFTVTCTPVQAGSYEASLTLTSNDPEQPERTYTLRCTGKAVPVVTPTVEYFSKPVPSSMLNFGSGPVNKPLTYFLTVGHTGNTALEVIAANITGFQAAQFKVLTPLFPLSILSGKAPEVVKIQCTPAQTGLHQARLTLKTNDPTQPSPTYSLNCTGEVKGAYDSIPAPGSLLNLGDSELGHSTTGYITLSAFEQCGVKVFTSTINGQNAEDFTLPKESAPFTLCADDSPQMLTIQCTPTELGSRQARLTLTTNDVSNPIVHYTLTCNGLPTVPPTIFSGKIRTQAGANDTHVSIDAPEAITLIGHITPLSRHIGRQATIRVSYHWYPNDGSPQLIVPIAFERQLTTQMDLTLFQGTLLGLPGVFEIVLGYQVEDEFLSDAIATLIIWRNRSPTGIKLSHNTVAENSPADTLVGLLSGVDADREERFSYILLDDAQGRFKIVRDELRVANGSLLEAEQQQQHDVTVRVIDTSQAYVDKTLTLYVTSTGETKPKTIYLTHQQVLENSLPNTPIGKFITRNNGQGDYQYTLLDDADGRFKLVDDVLFVGEVPLDFESQSHYPIVVRSQNLDSQEILEKTLDIELLNVTDVMIQNETIQDETGQALSHVEATQTIALHLDLIPDIEHQGETVELIGVGVYGQDMRAMMLADQTWQAWDGDFGHLAAVRTITLTPEQPIQLWTGQFAGFAGQTIKIFVGYRRSTGEMVYYPKPFEVVVD